MAGPPRAGGAICTRTFIPHDCHSAVGVLGAVTVATACVMPGSPAHAVAVLPLGSKKLVSVEHPTGEFTVELELDKGDPSVVRSAKLLRTARLIMRGEVMVPARIWTGAGR